MEDPTLRYATLAYSSRFLGWTIDHFRHIRTPEYFIGKAICAVRVHLPRQMIVWMSGYCCPCTRSP